MKRLLVGVSILLIVVLGLYYRVIAIDVGLLKKYMGPILQSVTEILAGVLIGTCLDDPDKSIS